MYKISIPAHIDEHIASNIYNDLYIKHATINFDAKYASRNVYKRQVGYKYLTDEKQFTDYENGLLTLEQSAIQTIKGNYETVWWPILTLYDMSYVSYIFIQYFENCCDTLEKIVINNGYNATVSIAYDSKDNLPIDDIIFNIINIIKIFASVADDNSNREYIFILSPFGKTMTYKSMEQYFNKYPWLRWTANMKDDMMRPFNINTGVSINHNIIFLYRLDEIYKVLFHECIHNFRYDIQCAVTCNKGNTSNSKSYICTYDNTKTYTCNAEQDLSKSLSFYVGKNEYPLLVNEAYTEYLALVMWVYYLCHYTIYYQKNKYNSDPKKLYIHMLQRELENSALQTYKLCKYYNISDLSILNKYNNLKQLTNAFSYVFIKYILLLHLIDINLQGNILIEHINKLMIGECKQIHIYNYLTDKSLDVKDTGLQLSAYSLI
jgi:hypothetical protein